jgi:hypothetical protein
VQIRLAEHEGTGVAQRRDQRCVLAGLKVPQRRSAGGGWQVACVDAVLDRDGKAMQGAERPTAFTLVVGCARGFQHLLGPQRDEGVERLAALALLEQCPRVLDRAQLTALE